MKPVFFASPAAFRRWLAANHAGCPQLLVGLRKVASGRPSMRWSESVDEALCFGWIDGVRRRIDDEAYCVRFTPRAAGSAWSVVNLRKAERLIRAGRMQAAGLAAYRARRPRAGGHYSYEQRPQALPAPYAARLRRHRAAARFFAQCAPSYRRAAIWWVVSAKQAATRERRLGALIEHAARATRLPQFAPRPR